MEIKNKIIYADKGKKIARTSECSFAEDFGSAFPMRPTETASDFVEVAIADLPPTRPQEDGQSYDEKVEALIRQRYTIGQELAIQRQRDASPRHRAEFVEYNQFCEDCKKKAKEEGNEF